MTFFALRDDLVALLEFLIADTGARLFEAYSDFDQELRTFESAEAVCRAYSLGSDTGGNGNEPFLQLWWPTVCASPRIERITLKPDAVPGHSFRHAVHGFGLAQLQCGGEHNGTIIKSHFGHFTEAGARAKGYDPSGPEGPVDWRALQKVIGRVQRHLRTRLAGGRVQGRGPVLHAAAAKGRAGWTFKESGRAPWAYDVALLELNGEDESPAG